MLVLVSGSYSGNGIHTDHDCAGGVVFRASTRLPPWIVPSRPQDCRGCVSAQLDWRTKRHDALELRRKHLF
jgi:hypothetical protein